MFHMPRFFRKPAIEARANVTVKANVKIYLAPADKASNVEECIKYATTVLEGHNVTTTAWCGSLATQFTGGSTAAALNYIGVGSGTTPATTSDTALQTQIGSLAAYTNRYVTSTTNANVAVFFSNSMNNGTWNETGLFDTGSTLVARAVSITGMPFSKTSAYVATIVWTITFTPS